MQSIFKQAATRKLNPLISLLIVIMLLLFIAALATPNLLRSRSAADSAAYRSRQYAAAEAKLQTIAADRDSLQPLFVGRQVIQTVDMSLLVDDPAKRLDDVTAIATQFRGYVESSQVMRAEAGGSAQVTLRVPAVSLEEARLALRRMAKKVEQEKASANDVTAQVVDLDATLRNYRAEEQQYLAIMQRAAAVKDTLEVAQRLAEVRGRIERTDAQRKLIAAQTEMASISVLLRAESIVSTDIQWMPNFRAAWRDAAESMAAYLATLTAIILYAPVVLAWMATILVLLVLSWRTLRWVWTRWFVVDAVPHA